MKEIPTVKNNGVGTPTGASMGRSYCGSSGELVREREVINLTI